MSLENAQALRMLKTALEMEEKGKSFYGKAIKDCKNCIGSDVFTTLMKDEAIHIERIKVIYQALTGGKPWNNDWLKAGSGHLGLVAFFKNLATKYGTDVKPESNDLDALSVGIGFEQKSVNFYTEELARATDPIERVFLEKMIAEEKGHFAVLTDMKFYLENPTAWFAEKERSGYDGA